jgi:hypothetical protein
MDMPMVVWGDFIVGRGMVVPTARLGEWGAMSKSQYAGDVSGRELRIW